jgi:hypothetical protein
MRLRCASRQPNLLGSMRIALWIAENLRDRLV